MFQAEERAGAMTFRPEWASQSDQTQWGRNTQWSAGEVCGKRVMKNPVGNGGNSHLVLRAAGNH